MRAPRTCELKAGQLGGLCFGLMSRSDDADGLIAVQGVTADAAGLHESGFPATTDPTDLCSRDSLTKTACCVSLVSLREPA